MEKAVVVTVHDKMQTGYTYIREKRFGQDFDSEFTPELTPKEMLALGVFEGHYLNDCRSEFPSDWFQEAKLSPQKPDVFCNCFHIKSRQSLVTWRQKGWIIGPDPRGWFQWYCRYYSGRRLKRIDHIQIKRWRTFIRHKAQVEKNCFPMDLKCRSRQRQAFLQWAYNPFF